MCSVNNEYDLATLDAGLLDAFSPESIDAKATASGEDLVAMSEIIFEKILPALDRGDTTVTLSYYDGDVLVATGVLTNEVLSAAIRF